MPDLIYYKGTGPEMLTRFEDQWRALWNQEAARRDAPEPRPATIWLLTICSHAKPYAKSAIHSAIRKALWQHRCLTDFQDARVCIIHMSSVGIIPTEAGDVYPFCAYDWNDAEATADERRAHQELAVERLQFWSETVLDKERDRVVTYFGPNCDNQVLHEHFDFLEKVRVMPAAAEPWALQPDPDDCLMYAPNLRSLVRVIRKDDADAWY